MTKTSQTKNDNNDINLIDLLIIILEGKWKIAIAMGISVLAIFAVQIISVNESKNFTATTEIIPINSAEESKYISFQNNIKHNDIFQIKTEQKKKLKMIMIVLSTLRIMLPLCFPIHYTFHIQRRIF